MPRAALALMMTAALAAAAQDAAAQAAPKPFKLGTFSRAGNEFVGIVLDDAKIIDLAPALAIHDKKDPSKRSRPPVDMKDLITRYDSELRDKIYAIVADASALSAHTYAVKDVKTLPPVRAAIILNGGGNYTEHSAGIAAEQARQVAAAGGAAPSPAASPTVARNAPGIWTRREGDTRPENPYLFFKSPTIVIANGEQIRVPRDRDRIDFECEFNTVIGKTAKRVPAAKALDYVFGYTIQIDVSDRGGRGDRKMGGSDWLVGKNHDTFAPLGPWITPKEFIKDPNNVGHKFTLNGTVMQDSNTSRMTHNVQELIEYATNILTLSPGDIISGGSPAGTNIERAEPRWMRAGDTATCAIEGIGALTHPVVAE
jgi:2-keto-4-pentenoate hydratase/2-oxohepta-3-ene-1,7-dioic acid hydratase in catechol pathway